MLADGSSGHIDAEGKPQVRFQLPDSFVEVPSPDGGAEAAEEWSRYLDDVVPVGEGIPSESIKQQYTKMRQLESLQGVVGSAICYGEVDDRITLAYLTVAFAPSQHADAVVAAEGIYRTQVELGGEGRSAGGDDSGVRSGACTSEQTSPGRLVQAVDLPVGPAVTVLTRQVMSAPPTQHYPDGIEVPSGMIQVFVPAPGRSYVLLLTLMTPTPDDLDDYAVLMADMAATITFDAEPSHVEQVPE